MSFTPYDTNHPGCQLNGLTALIQEPRTNQAGHFLTPMPSILVRLPPALVGTAGRRAFPRKDWCYLKVRRKRKEGNFSPESRKQEVSNFGGGEGERCPWSRSKSGWRISKTAKGSSVHTSRNNANLGRGQGEGALAGARTDSAGHWSGRTATVAAAAAFVSSAGAGASSAPPPGAHVGTGMGNGKRLVRFFLSSNL